MTLDPGARVGPTAKPVPERYRRFSDVPHYSMGERSGTGLLLAYGGRTDRSFRIAPDPPCLALAWRRSTSTRGVFVPR